MIIETLLAEVDKAKAKAQELREERDYFRASQYQAVALKLEDIVAYLVTGQVELD